MGVPNVVAPEPIFSQPTSPLAYFSAERAWANLEALIAIGPRVAGSEGAAKARAFIVERLEADGIEVREHEFADPAAPEGETRQLVNLIARIPGRSPSVFLLAAPYDTPSFDSFEFVGANEGGSGTALLIELAQVLAHRNFPYTVWIAFLDGESDVETNSGSQLVLRGSHAMASDLKARGELSRVRLAVVFDQVGDADLSISRDLFSHRLYRETFWSAAARLGRSDAFPPDAPYESPIVAHRQFYARDLRRVVAIVDTRYGGDEVPGVYWRTEDDTLEHCSPESLETVGLVTLEAMNDIAAHLQKIDRFVHSPLAPSDAGAP